MELNDNEFDATFRKKVFDADPQFEEAAWDKMERKLKRRDRIVFFRKSALILIALLAGVWGYYSFEKVPEGKIDQVSNNKKGQIHKTAPENGVKQPGLKEAQGNDIDEKGTKADFQNSSSVENIAGNRSNVIERIGPVATQKPDAREAHRVNRAVLPADTTAGVLNRQLMGSVLVNPVAAGGPALNGITVMDIDQRMRPAMIKKVTPVSEQALPAGKAIKVKRNLPVSLAISAGPEFNSASSVVGGDPGFNAGLTLGFGISKKLDLQAGVRYSIKKYSGAAGIRYNFPNTNATWLQNNLTGLDATCNVLEIPLMASYKVADNASRSINLNAGISSYLMLKEDYVFKYDNQYGAPTERTLQKANANQHLLSVVDLSATYFMKLKNNNLKIGLEPFVKIPLSGVGEGNINLKSSGISLKLRYDLDKKNN
jgi:hypothetical protein